MPDSSSRFLSSGLAPSVVSRSVTAFHWRLRRRVKARLRAREIEEAERAVHASVGVDLPTRPPEVRFVPLDPPGALALGPVRFDMRRPVKASQPPPPLYHEVRPHLRPVQWQLVQEALAQNVLERLPDRSVRDPSVRLVVKAKGDRYRLMADARNVNLNFVTARAPRCVWPTPSSVVAAIPALGRGPYFYATVDIRRFYDSLILPSELRGVFTSYVESPSGERVDVAFSRLPFGWAWAPYFAQLRMTGIVEDFLREYDERRPEQRVRWSVLVAVYFDDVLFVSRTACVLADVSAGFVAHVERVGLQVSKEKSVLQPSPSARWLGFRFDDDGTAVVASAISPARVRAALNGPTTLRRRQATLGAIRWHRPRVGPWLRALETSLSTTRITTLPRSAVNSAAKAAAMARAARLRPKAPIGVYEAGNQYEVVMFVDAAAAAGRAGFLLVESDRLTAVDSLRIPGWALGGGVVDDHRCQQLAELFALTVALRYVAETFPSEPDERELPQSRWLRRPEWQAPHPRVLVVSDSTSAIFSVLRSRASDHRRALLLRPIVGVEGVDLGYVPSELNPADAPSRGVIVPAVRSATGAIPFGVRAGLDAIRKPPGLWPRCLLRPVGLFRPHRRLVLKIPADHVDRPHESMHNPRRVRRSPSEVPSQPGRRPVAPPEPRPSRRQADDESRRLTLRRP